MPRFKLTIEYDGRPFVGMQAQKNGPSVQAALEAAIKAYCQADVRIGVAGRTDTGVHARAMAVHADIPRNDTPETVMAAVNAKLRPQPIAVLEAQAVADDFHARFGCVGRSYGYHIINRRAPITYNQGLAWHVPQALDLAAMQTAADHLVGQHDFTTFRHVHCQAKSPIKTLNRLSVEHSGEAIWVYADARSFLHSQVRSMVGCLVLVGRGHWSPDDMKAALEAKDRAALGYNAPPDGLYFLKAHYPEN
ncbi:MAG: tRNA pseudouridine(38-40) synthase TruA [Pseudomonadota bacterium]